MAQGATAAANADAQTAAPEGAKRQDATDPYPSLAELNRRLREPARTATQKGA